MSRLSRSRRFRWAASLAIVAAVGVLGAGWVGFQPDTALATPPSGSPPAPALAPPPAPPGVEPATPTAHPTDGRVSVPLPQFAGDALHYSATSLTYAVGSPDANNGKLLRGDIWIRMDDRGFVTEYAALYRDEQDKMAQAIYQNGQRERVAFGRPIMTDPRGITTCGFDTPSTPSRLQTPLYSQSADIARDGYVERTGTFNGPISQPARTFGQEIAGASGSLTRRSLAIESATGRVVGWRSVTTDGLGVRIAETSYTRGALEVLASGAIPGEITGAVLRMPIEGCQ